MQFDKPRHAGMPFRQSPYPDRTVVTLGGWPRAVHSSGRGVTPRHRTGASVNPRLQSTRTWERQCSWTQNCSDKSCILSLFSHFVFIEGFTEVK